MPIDRVESADTTLTPDAVVQRVLHVYKAGLDRCYRDYLKKDPKAGGTLTMRFTVDVAGRATSPAATGLPQGLTACVEGAMGKWTFPIPLDQDGQPMPSPFSFKLNLNPES